MRANGVLLVILVVAFLCPSDVLSLWGRRRRRNPPPKRPPQPQRQPQPQPPRRLPFCPLDKSVKIITERKRFGREIREFKRGTAWPYNCVYASILEYQGSFNYLPLIRSCCNSCNIPAFTTCINKYGGGSWRCPSQGIQCIVKCVNRHDPNIKTPKKSNPRRFHTRRRPSLKKFRFKPRPTARIVNPKCERKVIKGGKYCIERLCIPIKL